ncbi:hypothetical protein [Synechococcus sp. RSCCF101]|uniref:hypothetical protein n=1 Tax=Synechococcus sp. RSCCF101 TaxID=2511069 RepID=UPI001CD9443A|nr:hypothetical protein [Synechococcus sp. RSCCF101]
MIKVWHERNAWSHRVLPAMAELLDLGRIHNSQLSNLRNGKLAAPGPEIFLTLARLNALLAQRPAGAPLPSALCTALADVPELLAAVEASALPLLDGGGQPLGCGDLVEIFVGLRPPPPAYDWRIAGDAEAAELSAALADLLCGGRSWRSCRDEVMAAFPRRRRQDRNDFAAVMAGQAEYSARSLDALLPDLQRTEQALLGSEGKVGADGEENPGEFLERLRRRLPTNGSGPS